MKIDFNGYNIPIVTLLDNVPLGVSTTVGDADDFAVLLSAANASGVVRVKGRVNNVYMNGAMIASPYEDNDGIELHTITSAGADSPYVIFGQLVLDGSAAKITLTATQLS